MLPIKFQDNHPFVSGEEVKNRFSRWPIGLFVQKEKRKIDFQDGPHGTTILAIFDLQVTPMLSTKFLVNWPRGVGGEGF